MSEDQLQNQSQMENIESTENDNQYLTFIMDDEEYGVEIIKVQEIRGWSKVTPIPKAPSYVKGMINLRGQIVPIIDMRERFGLEHREYTNTTVVVVFHVRHTSGEQITGFVVDAVSDVHNFTKDSIKQLPDIGDDETTQFVEGVATIDDRMIIILDMNKLFGAQEMQQINAISQQNQDVA